MKTLFPMSPRPLLHAIVEMGVKQTLGVELDAVKCQKAVPFIQHVVGMLAAEGIDLPASCLPKVICSSVEQVGCQSTDPWAPACLRLTMQFNMAHLAHAPCSLTHSILQPMHMLHGKVSQQQPKRQLATCLHVHPPCAPLPSSSAPCGIE